MLSKLIISLTRATLAPAQVLLLLRDDEPSLDDAVGVEGDAVDPALDEELREGREVGRRLTAYAYLPPLLLDLLYHHGDHLLDRRVTLAVKVRYELRIPVEAEHQLSEIVRADGEPVEDRRELIGEDDVAGYLR